MKKRILLFGDSNTWGYISGSNAERYDEDTRWSGLLAKELGSEYVVIEEGHNGRTTVWDDPIENRMSGLNYLWPCLESQAPLDLVVFMLGSNNLKTYFPNTPEDIRDSMARLLDVTASSPFGREHKAPPVMIMAPILVKAVPHEPSFGPRAEEDSKRLGPLYEQLAKERGIPFLNAADYAWPDMRDGIHIALECHAPLAAAIAAKIREII